MDYQRQWSESEVEELANAAYAKRRLRCPRCSARVSATFAGVIGRTTEPVHLSCERCGAFGEYSPDHLEEMELAWTRDDKVRIIERYYANHFVRCPNDDAVLKVIESKTLGPPPHQVFFYCPHCGRSFNSNEIENEADPETFSGQYEKLSLLGNGGMGEVTLVRRKADGNLLAAKRVKPELLRDSSTVQRFQREARILSQLVHPNIVRIRQSFLDDQGGVVVMDYVDGGTLSRAINDLSLTHDQLLGYFEDVVAGVEYLHGQDVIHRDLKPGNVLIAANGPARVSDFGLARLVNRDTTTLTAHGAFLGTREYCAPEQQIDAAEVTQACDIYSLALIAYEIVMRRSPYRQPIDTSDFEAGFKQCLAACLAEDPQSRPPRPSDILPPLKTQLSASTK